MLDRYFGWRPAMVRKAGGGVSICFRWCVRASDGDHKNTKRWCYFHLEQPVNSPKEQQIRTCGKVCPTSPLSTCCAPPRRMDGPDANLADLLGNRRPTKKRSKPKQQCGGNINTSGRSRPYGRIPNCKKTIGCFVFPGGFLGPSKCSSTTVCNPLLTLHGSIRVHT